MIYPAKLFSYVNLFKKLFFEFYKYTGMKRSGFKFYKYHFDICKNQLKNNFSLSFFFYKLSITLLETKYKFLRKIIKKYCL